MNSTSKFALKSLTVGVLAVAAIASVATQAQAQIGQRSTCLVGRIRWWHSWQHSHH